MAYLRLGLILLIAGLLALWVYLVDRLAGESLDLAPAAETKSLESKPFRFATNDDCEECHREIFDEWIDDQHALSWFNRPLLPQDPKRTECNNCHAPLPILEVGVETLPRIRSDRFHEGVGCLECHRNSDHVEGPLPAADAACNPRHNSLFNESVICSSCHAPHGSMEEWRNSEWARKGYTCQACHMPLVNAPVVSGGTPQRRRSHRMVSQRDSGVLAGALELEVRLFSGQVEIGLTNTGAGHNVPGEIFNRELFLKTEIFDTAGALTAKHRASFKTVRREQRASIPSTQLRPGERRSLFYDLETAHGKIRILVGYKLLLYVPDQDAMRVHEREMEF